MPPAPSDHEIALENEVVRVVVSLRTGEVTGWTELATGLPLLVRPIGPKLIPQQGLDGEGRFLPPDPGGFVATAEENEVLVYDPFGHGGIAVQTLYRLLPGENAMEAEVALTNRTTGAIPLRMVLWPARAASFDTRAFQPLNPAAPNEEWSGWFGYHLLTLAGRTSFSFRVRFSAFGELGDGGRLRVGQEIIPDSEPHIGADASFGLGEAATIRVARPLRGARLFLQTEDGRTLEAPVDADPDQALVLPLGGLQPVGAMLRGADGTDLAPRLGTPSIGVQSTRLPDVPRSELSEEQLALLDPDVGLRHLAAVERARRATAAGEHARAEAHLETALLYNGDDPLTWWAKAGAQRRSDPERERSEWLNARYLRPLEPLVAAEALLAQQGVEPENPLLRIVADRETIAAGCLAAYAEAGAYEDAIALGGRILAVRDWRRVRLLMAGLYLVRTRMAMQAAEHWTAAARAESEESGDPGVLERELIAALEDRFGVKA